MSETGGRKDDVGKLRWDLLPAYALEKVVEVFTIGAEKYEDRNWERGIAFGRIFRAMMSHAWAWWRGERDDSEDGQHHLSSVAWCALALMELEQMHPECDDRPATENAQADIKVGVINNVTAELRDLCEQAEKLRPRKRSRSARRAS